MINGLLSLSSLRFYWRHPWQLALALAGIALGVAVFVGVQLANDSARRAFEFSTAAIQGATTHRLLPVGGGLAESHYQNLVLGGVTAAAPVIETVVSVAGANGVERRLTLLGIDPIKEARFRSYSSFRPGANTSLGRLLVEPAAVIVPQSLADDLGLRPDSTIELRIDGRLQPARVIGTTSLTGSSAEAEPPLITDISTAQELTDQFEQISRIDLALTPTEAEGLAANAPPGTVLVPAGSEDSSLRQMTQAFTTNLSALGLLALVVGMFLIYATISFAIVQRRKSIGIARAIGLTRAELLSSLLVEAAGIGIAGTLIGIAVGHYLATGLIELVLRTMDDLYFRSVLGAVAPSPWIYLQGAALGIGATVLSALVPALEAARRDTATVESRSALERASRKLSLRAAWLALPALAIAALLLSINAQSLTVAFLALFFVLCAGAMVTPAGTSLAMRVIEPVVARFAGLPGAMAVRGVTASLSRTGVATAALAVAVATVISIGLMISSFRVNLIDWLDSTLTADLYVIASANNGADGLTDQIAAVTALSAVRGISLSRFVRIPTAHGELGLRAATPGPDGWGLDIVSGVDADPTGALESEDVVLIAEPFAFRLGLRAGDTLELPTLAGAKNFVVAGVFRDYNTSGNALVMGLATHRQHWGDGPVTGIGVHLNANADTDAAAAAIRALFSKTSNLRIRSTAMLERVSLAIFDRTFQITEVLRLLAGLVAFLGVLSAVLAIQLEREREFAVSRALGMSAGELGRQVMTQTGLLGLAAGIAALPLGCALAWLLVYVINRRSFGWSMDLVITWPPLLQGLALALGAALLAGIYPSILGARTNASAMLRDE